MIVFNRLQPGTDLAIGVQAFTDISRGINVMENLSAMGSRNLRNIRHSCVRDIK